MTRHRCSDDENSVAFTVSSASEEAVGMGCLWSLMAAGVSGIIGLLIATVGTMDPGPSTTLPAQPVPVVRT